MTTLQNCVHFFKFVSFIRRQVAALLISNAAEGKGKSEKLSCNFRLLMILDFLNQISKLQMLTLRQFYGNGFLIVSTCDFDLSLASVSFESSTQTFSKCPRLVEQTSRHILPIFVAFIFIYTFLPTRGQLQADWLEEEVLLLIAHCASVSLSASTVFIYSQSLCTLLSLSFVFCDLI